VSDRENVFKGAPHMVVGSDNKARTIIKCIKELKLEIKHILVFL
jgi:hypothetical protein